jgi:hypothetical protein
VDIETVLQEAKDMQIELTYYWTHGVAAVVEFPNYVAEMRHNTFGTEIRQHADTENWLHLTLPAIETYNTRGPILYGATFRGLTNENARLDIIRLSDHRGAVLFQESVSLTDQEINQTLVNPHYSDLPLIHGALNMAIHVRFLTGTPVGRVVFGSGGAVLGLVVATD